MSSRKSSLPSITPAEIIADVQKMPSPRTIGIDKVGVKNISYPIVVLDKFNGTQHTVARINMFVNLRSCYKPVQTANFSDSSYKLNIYGICATEQRGCLMCACMAAYVCI